MKKLLSLPPNLVDCFHDIKQVSHEEYFCTSDPIGTKLGSGGGTAWLLNACKNENCADANFNDWIAEEKRILLHSGGQSRRLPSYAASSKALVPVPVFRWSKGQRFDQDLLDLQLSLYEQIMQKAPDSMHTMIVGGDVYIRASTLQEIPEADVVCYGLWVAPELAKNHGVFISKRETPNVLDCMLQKPSIETLAELTQNNLYLMDIGVWLLSDRAVELLMKRSMSGDECKFYDLYSDFGCSLGQNPTINDDLLKELSVVILPLEGGEFYHFGTTPELISSTLAIQNIVYDQREINIRGVQPHPAIFLQNAKVEQPLTAENYETWIENSYVGSDWKLSNRSVITGVPKNSWTIRVPESVCIDVTPVGDAEYVIRPYGYRDPFRGEMSSADTMFMGQPVTKWLSDRGLEVESIEKNSDIQSSKIFPISDSIDDLGVILRWMISEPTLEGGRELWMACRKFSADDIAAYANLQRMQEQRLAFSVDSWRAIAKNHQNSVFFHIDLEHAAKRYVELGLDMPEPLSDDEPWLKRLSSHIFAAQIHKLRGEEYQADEERAFELLREGTIRSIELAKQSPKLDVYSDQIVWGRSPVRIELGGGWSDTPPYCFMNGGTVLNMAVELNGQQPLQVYIRSSKEFKIVLRSIDLGASEEITTYDELCAYNKIGSPFSIPKAALALAGFAPDFCAESYRSLEQQLREFGSGIEVSLLSAIPAGSGLGTSSILATTVLASISDFCRLSWSNREICRRTLALEQLLTSAGGWQDQYGGSLHGVKLLKTMPGKNQNALVSWLPDTIFTSVEYAPCHLLYYTGITRTAKNILKEVVRGVALNSSYYLNMIEEFKQHAIDMQDVIQRGSFEEYGALVRKTWGYKQVINADTNVEAVSNIISQIEEYCLGYFMPGAGGGGYMYIVAKNPLAAAQIKRILTETPPNERARFVDMSISKTGLQVSRS